jgi:hypothetical protein
MHFDVRCSSHLRIARNFSPVATLSVFSLAPPPSTIAIAIARLRAASGEHPPSSGPLGLHPHRHYVVDVGTYRRSPRSRRSLDKSRSATLVARAAPTQPTILHDHLPTATCPTGLPAPTFASTDFSREIKKWSAHFVILPRHHHPLPLSSQAPPTMSALPSSPLSPVAPLWLLLLDIRRGKSVQFMAHPNLNIVDKTTVQVKFNEEDE